MGFAETLRVATLAPAELDAVMPRVRATATTAADADEAAPEAARARQAGGFTAVEESVLVEADVEMVLVRETLGRKVASDKVDADVETVRDRDEAVDGSLADDEEPLASVLEAFIPSTPISLLALTEDLVGGCLEAGFRGISLDASSFELPTIFGSSGFLTTALVRTSPESGKDLTTVTGSSSDINLGSAGFFSPRWL